MYSERTQRCDSSGPRLDEVILATGKVKRVLARSARETLSDVAISVPYVAWGQNTSARVGNSATSRRFIVVYNLRRRQVAYRVPARAFEPTGMIAFDVARSGSVGVVAERSRGGGCASAVVAWSSTSERRAHLLRVQAAGFGVRIAADTLVIARRGATCAARRLSAAKLRGRMRTLATFDPSSDRAESLEGDFDFDGRRLTYAVTRSSPSASKSRYETSLYLTRVPHI